MKKDIAFITKTSILYCAISAGFSMLGIFFAEKALQPNPLHFLSLDEVMGHFLWGLVPAIATLSLRYVIIGGAFAVLIDSDHLIGFFPVAALGRLSHSISFGIISLVVLMIVFGKKDYRLGAIAFAGMLSHISFDIFDEGPSFPILAPFYNTAISFSHIDWIYFEIAATVIIGIATLLTRRKTLVNLDHSTLYKK